MEIEIEGEEVTDFMEILDSEYYREINEKREIQKVTES